LGRDLLALELFFSMEKKQRIFIGALTLGVTLPCLALLPLDAVFNNDWLNHCWAIGYFGAYLKAHHGISLTVNTVEQVGMPFPVFYGYLFYPVLGFLSAFVGPELAVRIAALSLFALEFGLTYAVCYRLSKRREVSVGIACLVVWAIYPLTNLYHRGALPEFFATGLLTCAVNGAVLFAAGARQKDRIRFLALAGLCLVLAMGMHPITAFLGGPFFLVSLGICLHSFGDGGIRGEMRALKWPGLGIVILSALVLAPWIFAVFYFLPGLHVPGNLIFYDRFDWWAWRLWPVPYDPGVQVSARVGSPFLEAQMSLPLFLLGVGLIGFLRGERKTKLVSRNSRRAQFFCWTLGLGVFLLSTLPMGPVIARALGIKKVIGIAQIAYRLTTYINGFALVGVYLVLWELGKSGKKISAPFFWIVVSLAFWSGYQKVNHALIVRRWVAPGSTRWLVHLPDTFYSTDDYAITRGLPTQIPPTNPRLYFPVSAEDSFGDVSALEVDLKAGWYLTNVAPFPWSQIEIDGQRLSAHDMAVGHADRLANASTVFARQWMQVPSAFMAIRMPPGKHRLTFQVVPLPFWVFLRALSGIFLIAWVSAVIWLFLPFPSLLRFTKVAVPLSAN